MFRSALADADPGGHAFPRYGGAADRSRRIPGAGPALGGAAVLDRPEDVFHFTLPELTRAGRSWPPPPELVGELQMRVRQRKQRRAELASSPLVEQEAFGQPVLMGDELLRGTPGSPGVAKGPARIIRDGSEFGRLLPGDVLVAPFTNPAWTPLFQRAAAIVVDSGGAGSHAAIVAREYGVPAVMGTGDGTKRLRDGQQVRVDGSRGSVFRCD